MVVAQAADLGLPTVPELHRGQVSSARELEALTLSLAAQPSVFGGPREGVVVRRAGEFRDADFQKSLAKWVRHDHVTTDEHWMHQDIRPQKLAKSAPSRRAHAGTTEAKKRTTEARRHGASLILTP
jgi:hypothetical protein